MTEPRVSYKGLEEPTNLVLVPRLVVTALVATMLLLFCGSTHATLTSSTDGQKDVLARAQRSQMMLNHSSMPAMDINNQGAYSSSISSYDSFDYSADYSSLPMTVEEEGDGYDEIKPSCSEDHYLDHSLNVCKNCTVCGPGMQHKVDQKCGYGNGFEQICEPCPDEYYQDGTSSYLVRCKRCISCDKHAETIQNCTREQNTQCGPCAHGMYYFLENICVPCVDGDSDREECMMTRRVPLELTEPSLLPSPETPDISPAAVVGPIQMISHTDETGSPAKGTASNTTDQTVHGGKHRTGGNVEITVVLVVISTSALAVCFVVFKLVKRRRERAGVKASPQGKDADMESCSGNPEQKSDLVCYTVQDETIGYSAISQEEPCHDKVDQPQTLRSDLPFDHSQMGTVCPSFNGPWGQDTPPACLPREDAAVLQ